MEANAPDRLQGGSVFMASTSQLNVVGFETECMAQDSMLWNTKKEAGARISVRSCLVWMLHSLAQLYQDWQSPVKVDILFAFIFFFKPLIIVLLCSGSATMTDQKLTNNKQYYLSSDQYRRWHWKCGYNSQTSSSVAFLTLLNVDTCYWC